MKKSWNDITLDEFIELREVEMSPFDSFIDKYIELLSILQDVDPVELEEKEPSQLIRDFKKYAWIYQEPSSVFSKEIGEYKYKELSTLTNGEYIELIHLFSDDYYKNLSTICAVLYRKQMTNEWDHILVEPYEYNPKERESVFIGLPITKIFGVIKDFLKFKADFEKNYAPLFEPEFGEADEDYEPSEDDKLDEEKKKFSWESFIYNLCNGDLTKTDDVLNLGVIYTFNMLSMRKTLGS